MQLKEAYARFDIKKNVSITINVHILLFSLKVVNNFQKRKIYIQSQDKAKKLEKHTTSSLYMYTIQYILLLLLHHICPRQERGA